MKEIIFVTGNYNKVEEAREILANANINIVQDKSGYIEIQAEDLEDIAKYGAEYAANKIGKPVIIDDSGLFIDFLNGFPGPYSSYVFKTLGNKGILKLMHDAENRSARFKSVVGFCKPNEKPIVFSGIVKGNIAHEIRGSSGFGYDPIFEVNGKTFGEMENKEKNKISHRYRAFKKFMEWLNSIVDCGMRNAESEIRNRRR
ncbi:MAG: XTP/dITP diphosphatase [Methanosarcinales archaeon]